MCSYDLATVGKDCPLTIAVNEMKLLSRFKLTQTKNVVTAIAE